MFSFSILDFSKSVDRHNLLVLRCKDKNIKDSINFIENQNINVINVGKELSEYISSLTDYAYLSIDIFDFLFKLFDSKKVQIESTVKSVLAIHNVGILLEPKLELNISQFLKDFSKNALLIILWENEIENETILNWPFQKDTTYINLNDTPLKIINYEV